MANKKSKKKNKKLKKTGASKKSAAKKAAKKLVKKKSAPKKAERKTKTVRSKPVSSKTAGAPKKRVATSSDPEPYELQEMRSRSAGQSGDLQGLSNTESADSESVDELIEEGNAFEADVVSGVESAGDDDEKEVRTHEVPEDDVPGEYLDEE